MKKLELTAEQKAVVESDSAQLTVLAAAGSGKTRTLVARYLKHVIEDKMRPDQILTITFTRKAAALMKRRIVENLLEIGLSAEAQIAETGPIQTIHGFCERLLRENAVAAGIDPKFEVMDDYLVKDLTRRALLFEIADNSDDPLVANLLHLCAGKMTYEGTGDLEETLVMDVQEVLSRLRGANRSLSELEGMYRDFSSLRAAIEAAIPPDEKKRDQLIDSMTQQQEHLEHACALMQLALGTWKTLEKEMDARQSFDFAELERRAVELVEGDVVTAERVRRQYPVVLIDEAQDLNPMQYRLLTSMKIGIEMLVGDPQQSVYGFRQADYRQFVARAQQTDSMPLSGNYRSGREILEFIDLVFATWWKGDYKGMEPKIEDNGVVSVFNLSGDQGEIMLEMVRAAHAEGHKLGDIAILVREGKQAQGWPELLAKSGIASRVVGGKEGYYNRMHVRDLANLLEALAQPDPELSLFSLLHSPIVGLTLDSIVELAHPRQPLVWRLNQVRLSDPDDQAKLADFLKWFEPLRKYADRLSAWEVLSEVFRHSPYLERIARQPQANQAIANARKLLQLAVADQELGPLEFAEKIRAIQKLKVSEGDAPAVDEGEDTVKIINIHKAKGLEFPVVIIPSLLNKPRIPNGVLVDQKTGLVFTRYGGSDSGIYTWCQNQKKKFEEEEEKRVLYVAFTRAIQRLMICTGSRDGTWGKRILDMIPRDSKFHPSKGAINPSGSDRPD